jgi:alkylhydroperoxidase family enzyme
MRRSLNYDFHSDNLDYENRSSRRTPMEPAVERIAPLEPPHPPETQAHLAALMPKGWTGPALRLFRLWARHLPMAEALRGVGRYVLADGTLPPRDRELLILRTTARCNAEYEWGVHAVFFPPRVGLDTAQVAATRTGKLHGAGFTARDRLLIALADALHDTSTAPDDLWNALAAEWTETQLLEALLVCGFYHLVSFTANATHLATEPFAARFPS